MKNEFASSETKQCRKLRNIALAASMISVLIISFSINLHFSQFLFYLIFAIAPAVCIFHYSIHQGRMDHLEKERNKESKRRSGKKVLGAPPRREAFKEAMELAKAEGKVMLDKYLVGFELDSGKPIWVNDEDLCTHACVFAKTGVGKTLWLEGIMFQQMARARASGLTFIDAKRDAGTLADIILMALLTGRIEDLIVVDPFDPVFSYNFVLTNQKADVKARKVLRCGLPVTSDQSVTKHYDRLAADAIYRVVRSLETLGLAWSIKDVASCLSAFNVAYPRLREMLSERGEKNAMIELGHLASTYRSAKGNIDQMRVADNLRGIASELHSIAHSQSGAMLCTNRSDLSLTAAIKKGKIIYYMLPRLEEAESASRMVKVFREDLEVSIGEITSDRSQRLEDPHLVVIDEGASTFGPTWANLFELARKGRFAMLFGAQSVAGLMDEKMGLSKQFYERVIANVSLKVVMQVGDNQTAKDMSTWSSRASELVSSEELKHEMSAEKGLAWFDMGDGRICKGRTIWFESDLPPTWDGRNHLVRHQSIEHDEVGLADWVNDYIFSLEQDETKKAALANSEEEALPIPPTEVMEEKQTEEQSLKNKIEKKQGPFRLKATKATIKEIASPSLPENSK